MAGNEEDTPGASTALTVEVWFDFICPWCLIGKRQLQRALAELQRIRPEVAVTLQWHGVSLLPELPPQGVDYRDFYRHRLGGDAAVQQRQQQVKAVAATVDVEINFTAIQRMPNTALAHHAFRLLQATEPADRVDAVLEGWFRLHFIDGGDLGDATALARYAEAAGVPAGHLPLAPATPVFPAVEPTNGVPAFRINGRRQLTGAVGSATLLSTMVAALEEVH